MCGGHAQVLDRLPEHFSKNPNAQRRILQMVRLES
jgi:hypothetical protein